MVFEAENHGVVLGLNAGQHYAPFLVGIHRHGAVIVSVGNAPDGSGEDAVFECYLLGRGYADIYRAVVLVKTNHGLGKVYVVGVGGIDVQLCRAGAVVLCLC